MTGTSFSAIIAIVIGDLDMQFCSVGKSLCVKKEAVQVQITFLSEGMRTKQTNLTEQDHC